MRAAQRQHPHRLEPHARGHTRDQHRAAREVHALGHLERRRARADPEHPGSSIHPSAPPWTTQGLTATIVDTYRRRDALWLAITPEGTRGKVEHLQSSF